jgi:hypothetical protein
MSVERHNDIPNVHYILALDSDGEQPTVPIVTAEALPSLKET